MGKKLLVDGMNLAFRSYHALPELTSTQGFPTGALHGWVKTFWKIEQMEQPELISVFFDTSKSTRHVELLPEYKAQRGKMPEALAQQIPYLKKIAQMMGFPVIEKDGIEADDLIASAAYQEAKNGHEVIIVSSDKDFAQCLKFDGIYQLLPAPTANPRIGWRKIDKKGVWEKFAVQAEQIPDYLALIGDSSDNIPGIKGVGPKTASKWIDEFGSTAKLLSKAQSIKPPRFRPILSESKALLERNLELIRLQYDHPIEALKPQKPQAENLIKLFQSMDMQQVAKEVPRHYPISL